MVPIRDFGRFAGVVLRNQQKAILRALLRGQSFLPGAHFQLFYPWPREAHLGAIPILYSPLLTK